VANPLAHWANRHGALAKMGCDYSSCPGELSLCLYDMNLNSFYFLATSTDIERAFSGGRLTVSRMRHSLSSESTRASTVLGTWMKVDGFLDELELTKRLKAKVDAKTAGPQAAKKAKQAKNIEQSNVIHLE
jgi:hypothetical protein